MKPTTIQKVLIKEQENVFSIALIDENSIDIFTITTSFRKNIFKNPGK